MVVLLHVQHLAAENDQSFSPFRGIPLGFGVDVFFVISGFIIALTSRELIERREVGRFVSRRLIRVVPLYWVCLSLWIVLTAAKGAVTGNQAVIGLLTPDNLLASYLFIPADTRGYGADYPFPLLVLGWTLNYEMFFYGLFALCLLGGPRRFYPALAGLLVGLVVAGWAFPNSPLPLSFWTRPLILEFLAGIALAQLYRREVRLGAVAQAILIGGGLLIWLFVREGDFGPVPPEAKGSYSWPRLFSGGAGALLIMAAAALARAQWGGRLMGWWARLGDSSYAVYLTHAITLALARGLIELAPFAIAWSWPVVVLVTIAAIAVGHGFHLLFERPLMRWLHRRFAGGRTQLQPA